MSLLSPIAQLLRLAEPTYPLGTTGSQPYTSNGNPNGVFQPPRGLLFNVGILQRDDPNTFTKFPNPNRVGKANGQGTSNPSNAPDSSYNGQNTQPNLEQTAGQQYNKFLNKIEARFSDSGINPPNLNRQPKQPIEESPNQTAGQQDNLNKIKAGSSDSGINPPNLNQQPEQPIEESPDKSILGISNNQKSAASNEQSRQRPLGYNIRGSAGTPYNSTSGVNNGTVQQRFQTLHLLRQGALPAFIPVPVGVGAINAVAIARPPGDTGRGRQFTGADSQHDFSSNEVKGLQLDITPVVPNLGFRRSRYKPKQGNSGLTRVVDSSIQMPPGQLTLPTGSEAPIVQDELPLTELEAPIIQDELPSLAEGDGGDQITKNTGIERLAQNQGPLTPQKLDFKNGLRNPLPSKKYGIPNFLKLGARSASAATKAAKVAAKAAKVAAKAGGLLARLAPAIAGLLSHPIGWIIIGVIILIIIIIILVVVSTNVATETAVNEQIRNSRAITDADVIKVLPVNMPSREIVQRDAFGQAQKLSRFKFIINYTIDLDAIRKKVFIGSSNTNEMQQYRVVLKSATETFLSRNKIKSLAINGQTLSSFTVEESNGVYTVSYINQDDQLANQPCNPNKAVKNICEVKKEFVVDFDNIQVKSLQLAYNIKLNVEIGPNASPIEYQNGFVICFNVYEGNFFRCEVGSPARMDDTYVWPSVNVDGGANNDVVSIDDLTLACPLDKNNTIQCNAGRNYPRNWDSPYAGKPHNALDLVPSSTNWTVYVASEAQRIKINNTNPMCGATVILYNGSFATLYAHVDGDAIASTSASLKNAMDQQNNVVEINDLQIGSVMGRLKEINGNAYFSNGTLCASGTHLHFTILTTDGTPVEGLYDKVNQACEGKINRCPDE